MQTQTQAQPHNRYGETDNRDWCARTVQPPAANEEKSWDNIREAKAAHASSGRQQEQVNRQDQLNHQFASKAQVCSRQELSVTFVPFDLIHYFFHILNRLIFLSALNNVA